MPVPVEVLMHQARVARMIAQDGLTISCGCVFCDVGHEPVRLRRRWVHHLRGTGRLIVCNYKNLKPQS